MSLKVGLTGGIGSGKSTVARLLAAEGAAVIDADRLSREVVAPGSPALARIVETFGAELLDEHGALDRKRMGQLVFGDPERRRALNAIVHPAVAEAAVVQIAELERAGAPVIVYDVPLLFENSLERSFDEVVVVFAPPEVQAARIAARDGLSPAEIEARLAAQHPITEKAKRADVVIDNSGGLAQTQAAVRALWARWQAAAGEREQS